MSLIELIQSLPQHCDLIKSADVEGWNIVIHTTRPFSESALMPRTEVVIPLGYDPSGIESIDVAYNEAIAPGKTQIFIDRAVGYVKSLFPDESVRLESIADSGPVGFIDITPDESSDNADPSL